MSACHETQRLPSDGNREISYLKFLTEVRRRIPILVTTDKGRCSYVSVCVRDGVGEAASSMVDRKRRAVDNLEIIDCLFAYVIAIECASVAVLQRFSGNYSPVSHVDIMKLTHVKCCLLQWSS